MQVQGEKLLEALKLKFNARLTRDKRMAMVDALPVPDSRQKVDELFLFWLSEPSAQELLRKELSKVCGYELTDSVERSHAQPAALTNLQRPKSPTYRTPSPPLHLSNSPKSPRAKRRSKSPRRHLKSGLAALGKTNNDDPSTAAPVVNSEEVDVGGSGSPQPSEQVQNARAASTRGTRGKEDAAVDAGSQPPAEPDTPTTKDASLQALEPQKSTPAEERDVQKSVEAIPRFFFPNGQPSSGEDIHVQLNEAAKLFQQASNGEVPYSSFHTVVKVTAVCSNHLHLCGEFY